MDTKPCQLCNIPLKRVTNMTPKKNGQPSLATLPLDDRNPIYAVYKDENTGRMVAKNVKALLAEGYVLCKPIGDLAGGGEFKKLDVESFHVSHFATCTKADSFGKGGGHSPER